ncbi:putative alpha-L-fucosidase [Bombyx mori]|uniref:Putative alpha-L-fucosidase n=1 Tax=Bombyx mori TaxID=7091 RepID=A0A8D5Y487_BOMMO|nr:putative alpha-L-fucosidase [Bombyx mori]XP_021209165.1 putative alpha-L-fucosidase [Bombyx mori]BCX80342.1 alpha-L-fucosidase [Bombyx mori]
MKSFFLVFLFGFVNGAIHNRRDHSSHNKILNKRYSPDWNDLDTRPLPEWYDKAKIGIFLHWGVYSVPGFGSEWFWSNWKGGNRQCIDFMTKNYPPGFTYQEFAPAFKAEFFDPDKWADLFVKAGAKYVVLTSKHHEGFTLFPSKRSFSWNSVEVGPKRDIVGDLAKAVRNTSLKFGVYHSLYEWFNPIYEEDKRKAFKTQTYVDTKLWPDIKQIVHDYKPSVIWSDGDWEANDTYWRSTELLAWLYNDSPVKDEVVVNDRWGIGIPGKHGDFYNHQDRFNPGVLLHHKWENAFTVDSGSWGYRRNMQIREILTIEELLQQIVTTVSCGGNALINVGPTKEGTIAPIFEERLLALGDWLQINGEAIYSSSPWEYQNDTLNGKVWYTCSINRSNSMKRTYRSGQVTAIYAILLEWPSDNRLSVRSITNSLRSRYNQLEMLGNEGTYLNWKITNGDVEIELPDRATVKSNHAWVLKLATT